MGTKLAEVARRSDEATAAARRDLVAAVREASAQGWTQAQIAREIGRSQPEVSRLLRFHGAGPLARRLRQDADAVRTLIADAGGSRVRVFGSVATGKEDADSDIDLLFTMSQPMSLMQLGRLEGSLADLLGVPVDLVPESALRPDIRDRIASEAVAL